MAKDDFEHFDRDYEDPMKLLDNIKGGCVVNWDHVTEHNIGEVLTILENQGKIPTELPHRVAVILNLSNFQELGLSQKTLESLQGVLGKAFSAGNLDRVLPVC